jgi:hypothetical protein
MGVRRNPTEPVLFQPLHAGVVPTAGCYVESTWFFGRVTEHLVVTASCAPTRGGFRLVEVGAFELKGIAKPLILYEAIRDGDA